jgi:hypothetical protein
LQEEFAYIDQNIKELNVWLNDEYNKAKSEVVRFVIVETSDLLQEAGCERVIGLPSA